MKTSIGLIKRRRSALERLEQNLKDFQSKKQDKVTTRGKTIPYDKEVERIKSEINTLKSKIH